MFFDVIVYRRKTDFHLLFDMKFLCKYLEPKTATVYNTEFYRKIHVEDIVTWEYLSKEVIREYRKSSSRQDMSQGSQLLNGIREVKRDQSEDLDDDTKIKYVKRFGLRSKWRTKWKNIVSRDVEITKNLTKREIREFRTHSKLFVPKGW